MHESETQAQECRALTVVTPPARPQAPLRRDSAFLAHLLATRAQAPQTRARRRAEPAEALGAYRLAARLASSSARASGLI